MSRGDVSQPEERRPDPDEFFRRFPGDFLFFPVVTPGGGSAVCRQFAVKFLQPTSLAPFAPIPCDTRGWLAAAFPDARNGRGLLAETHKTYTYIRLPSNLLEPHCFAACTSAGRGRERYFTSSRRLSAIGTLSLFPRWD